MAKGVPLPQPQKWPSWCRSGGGEAGSCSGEGGPCARNTEHGPSKHCSELVTSFSLVSPTMSLCGRFYWCPISRTQKLRHRSRSVPKSPSRKW